MIKQGSDELLSRKYDQCLARLIVNGGIGLATGVGLSVILFRRRFWPIPLSFGFSAECRSSLSPEANLAGILVRKPLVKPTTDAPVESSIATEGAVVPVVVDDAAKAASLPPSDSQSANGEQKESPRPS